MDIKSEKHIIKKTASTSINTPVSQKQECKDNCKSPITSFRTTNLTSPLTKDQKTVLEYRYHGMDKFRANYEYSHGQVDYREPFFAPKRILKHQRQITSSNIDIDFQNWVSQVSERTKRKMNG